MLPPPSTESRVWPEWKRPLLSYPASVGGAASAGSVGRQRVAGSLGLLVVADPGLAEEELVARLQAPLGSLLEPALADQAPVLAQVQELPAAALPEELGLVARHGRVRETGRWRRRRARSEGAATGRPAGWAGGSFDQHRRRSRRGESAPWRPRAESSGPYCPLRGSGIVWACSTRPNTSARAERPSPPTGCSASWPGSWARSRSRARSCSRAGRPRSVGARGRASRSSSRSSSTRPSSSSGPSRASSCSS